MNLTTYYPPKLRKACRFYFTIFKLTSDIKIGMDKTEVETILGDADNCVDKTLHADCVWGSDTKNIKVTFVSNKVTLYSNHGFAK